MIDTEQFTPEVRQLLSDAGWRPGRRVDTTPIRQQLTEAGFVVTPPAEVFLAEFHGLNVRARGGPFDIDVPRLLGWLESRELPWVERLAGESVCPVAHGLFAVVLIGASGRCYGLQEIWLSFSHWPRLSQAFQKLFFFDGDRTGTVRLSNEHRPPWQYHHAESGGAADSSRGWRLSLPRADRPCKERESGVQRRLLRERTAGLGRSA